MHKNGIKIEAAKNIKFTTLGIDTEVVNHVDIVFLQEPFWGYAGRLSRSFCTSHQLPRTFNTPEMFGVKLRNHAAEHPAVAAEKINVLFMSETQHGASLQSRFCESC